MVHVPLKVGCKAQRVCSCACGDQAVAQTYVHVSWLMEFVTVVYVRADTFIGVITFPCACLHVWWRALHDLGVWLVGSLTILVGRPTSA